MSTAYMYSNYEQRVPLRNSPVESNRIHSNHLSDRFTPAPVHQQRANMMSQQQHQLQQQQQLDDGIFPRSASEATFDNTMKFRQLPCRTFISVGTCPYRERCVYLHDPRAICREAKTKTRRKNKEDVGLDSLFWPIMPYSLVAGKQDSNRQPHVIQSYMVPPPQNEQYRLHDQAVYSLWMHFVDFCMACSESTAALNNGTIATADAAPCFAAPDVPINSYTKTSRLPVFRAMSNGRSPSEMTTNKQLLPVVILATPQQQPATIAPALPMTTAKTPSPVTITAMSGSKFCSFKAVSLKKMVDYSSDDYDSEGTSGESVDHEQDYHNGAAAAWEKTFTKKFTKPNMWQQPKQQARAGLSFYTDKTDSDHHEDDLSVEDEMLANNNNTWMMQRQQLF